MLFNANDGGRYALNIVFIVFTTAFNIYFLCFFIKIRLLRYFSVSEAPKGQKGLTAWTARGILMTIIFYKVARVGAVCATRCRQGDVL